MEKLFRYEQIAAKVEHIIFSQKLQPGDKIPSVRFISRELGVSPATVAQAYSLLDAKGILIPKSKSGFYVGSAKENRSSISPRHSAKLPEAVDVTTMVTAMSKNMRKHNVVDFSSLGPSQELMPIARLHKALFQSTKEAFNGHYTDPFHEGSPRLQNQIALHTIPWAPNIAPEDILITNGCMEAISLCLDATVKTGEIVAVESPTFECILQCLENKGIKAIGIRVDPEYGLDVDELEEVIQNHNIAAGIFSPSCQNPLGCSMPEAQKIRLVNLMAINNIPFIEDDALGELYFGTTRPVPAKAHDQCGNILYCSSFSKTLTPGFRIGWVNAGRFHSQLERLKFATNISTNTMLQDTLARYLEGGNYPRHLKKLRKAIHMQTINYREAIIRHFPEETKVSLPQGGYCLWIELPNQIDALAVQRAALKLRIGLYPGIIFSTSRSFRSHIRINCGPLYNPKIDEALNKLGQLVEYMS